MRYGDECYYAVGLQDPIAILRRSGFEFPRRALSWVMQFDASNIFQFQERVRTLVSSADYFLGLETGDWRGKRAYQIPTNISATSHSYSL